MDHLGDPLLLELAAGRASEHGRALAADHLAVCLDCRARLDALTGVWRQLGDWEVPPARRDLSGAIRAAAEAEAAASRRLRLPATRWWQPLRVAAALALAAGLGHAAGRWTWPPSASPPVVTDEAAAEALSLDLLEDPSPAGLSDVLLALEEGGHEEVPG